MAGLRRWAGILSHVAGWLVVILALVFLGQELWRSSPWRLAGARAPELALAVAVGAVAYGLAGFLLAEAWRRLLGPGPAEAYPRHHRALYGRTQIAKYLPGNVFHFVGRQILGRRLGHRHAALALASVAETASLLLVAGVFALPLVWPRLEHALEAGRGWLLVVVAGISIGVICVGCRHGHDRRLRAALAISGRLRAWTPRALQAGLLHAAFFAVAGLIFLAVAAAIQAPGERPLAPATAISALAAAWLAGFVVPGSAAGVGVREAILVLILEQHLANDEAMLLALALRLVTTSGDFLFFALCSFTGWELQPRSRAARTDG